MVVAIFSALATVATSVGKAMGPISKVKKMTWNAMGSAFSQVKSALNPMQDFAKALKFITVLMKPFTILFTVLGAAILMAALPAIEKFIEVLTSPTFLRLMEELGYIIGTLILVALEALIPVLWELAPILAELVQFFRENEWAMALLIAALKTLLVSLWALYWVLVTLKLIFHTTVDAVNTLSNAFEKLLGWVKGLSDAAGTITGDGGDGGDGDGDGGGGNGDDWWDPFDWFHAGGIAQKTGNIRVQKGEVIGSKHSRGGTTNIIHVHLENAIIDNRDRLVRDIAEQVVIRIG